MEVVVNARIERRLRKRRELTVNQEVVIKEELGVKEELVVKEELMDGSQPGRRRSAVSGQIGKVKMEIEHSHA